MHRLLHKFVNLKISTKFRLSFFIVALFSACIALFGIFLGDGQAKTIFIAAACLLNITAAVFLSNVNERLVSIRTKTNQQIMEKLVVGDLDFSDIYTKGVKKRLAYTDEIGEFSRTFSDMVVYLMNIVDSIEKIAEGDLVSEVPVKSAADKLGNHVYKLVKSYHRLVSNIVMAGNELAREADLVSSSSVTLAQGATEQASSIEELTASLEQISQQTNLNAQNAESANGLIQQVKTNAMVSNEQMKDLLAAMSDIHVSSNDINRIIKVIDDIAFQTNILALNAAVEAARAGQSGKGFAVVADEVRNLATKSADAAKETTVLIENSISKVASGLKIADLTAATLDEIAVQVDQATDLIGSIAQASAEQAQNIGQVNIGIAQISQAVQINAAAAEECAATSEELTNQAEKLKAHTSVFKLREAVPA